MPRPKKTIALKDLQGFKIIKKFQKFLKQAQVQCPIQPTELDPKRKLSKQDYFSLFLFTFLNPVITSMRGLCAASELNKIQDKVSSTSVSLGSFSEAQNGFDPQLLLSIIQILAKQFEVSFGDKRLHQLAQELVAVDGTLIRALPRMSWALWQDESHRSAKLHLHYAFLRQSVIHASLTDAKTCERAELAKHLEKSYLYTADRYYGGDYGFFLVFDQMESYFVIRIRNDAIIHELETFPLTEADEKAGVFYDKKVLLGKVPTEIPYRLIKVKAYDTTLLILTNRWDIPAELISTIYRYRWEIETLFKWIKCNLQCRHLLAESLKGVTIQIYLAIIASMLLFLAIGRKPTKRELELIHFYSIGWASLKELIKGLTPKKRA